VSVIILVGDGSRGALGALGGRRTGRSREHGVDTVCHRKPKSVHFESCFPGCSARPTAAQSIGEAERWGDRSICLSGKTS